MGFQEFPFLNRPLVQLRICPYHYTIIYLLIMLQNNPIKEESKKRIVPNIMPPKITLPKIIK